MSQLRCHTTDGVLVDRDTVLRTLLEGYVRFVILDDDGVPHSVGAHTPPVHRSGQGSRALPVTPMYLSRLSGRAGRCQTDHGTEWHEHGETCPENGNWSAAVTIG